MNCIFRGNEDSAAAVLRAEIERLRNEGREKIDEEMDDDTKVAGEHFFLLEACLAFKILSHFSRANFLFF